MPRIGFCRGLVAAVLLALAAPAAASQAAAEDSPKAVVQAFYDVLLANMKGGEALGYGGRLKALGPALAATYDLPGMAKVSVGAYWKDMTDDQKAKLIDLFTRSTASTYAGRFKAFKGEEFQVGEEADTAQGLKMVPTTLVTSKGEKVALNYIMRKAPAGWRIVDVSLGGTVSELATRRSEYTSVIQAKGIDGLLALLTEKIGGKEG